MILIITNRQDQTADYLILELKKRGTDFVRFNTEDYPSHVWLSWGLNGGKINGFFTFPRRTVGFDQITSVWYRRPVTPVPGLIIDDAEEQEFVINESRAVLEGIWRTLECFWVSHPDALRAAEDKLFQLKTAQSIGFNVYPTLVTNIPSNVSAFYDSQGGKIVYKPLRHGRLNRDSGTSLIFTNRIEPKHKDLFHQVELAPSLFQRYIQKQVELRITVIGEKVFAVEIHSQENSATIDDWRKVGSEKLKHKFHCLPKEIEEKCLQLLKVLHLEFGAIDMILTTEGEYVFLEINPNGQWAWIQQICPDIPLRETLAELLMKDCIAKEK